MNEVTNNFYISGNYIAEQHIENQHITYADGSSDHVSGYPLQGDYAGVCAWLEKRKARGEDYYAGAGYNRTEMCRRLSKIFGWEVSPNSILNHEKLKKK